MFRAAQANPFDDAVAKATDENLTSENWEYILDVCDKVEGSDTGASQAVAAMIKRLAHRNANVQLYTLELANSLSQNCGPQINKELSSRSFTDAMIRLASDRNTHQHVKTKILERMEEWSESFAKDPDLGIMEQAYGRLKSQNPNLQPPSKPFKQQITDADRQKEEDELQMALALSIKDKSTQNEARKQSQSGPSQTDAASPSGATQPSLPQGTTAATVSRVRALYDFIPSEAGELQFRKGDIIAVLESVYKDWWKGSLRGQTGIFPLNYVEKLQDPTQEELERDAQMESDVFAEIKNVEKLLALLSTSTNEASVRDNDEITSLYNQTVAVRPKLIELISKYSQKKDDFTQLNEKFIKARRDYEGLLEASMSHAAQNPYGRPPPANSYGYPPPSSHGYGAPPPQQDPSNYYSAPPPQQQQAPPPQQQHPPPPQQQPSEPSYPPPRNGPAPFYMIPPGQQPQSAAAEPAPAPAPGNMSPTAYSRPPQQYHAPEQRSSVQELATTNYDPTSPHEANPYGPPPTTAGAPPSQQPPYGHHDANAPGYGGRYTASPPPAAAPPQPPYAPPPAPSSQGGSYPPPSQGGSYPPLGPQHTGASTAYSGYPPQAGPYAQPSGGHAPPKPADDVSDYYR